MTSRRPLLLIAVLAAVWLAMLAFGGRGLDHRILLSVHAGGSEWLSLLLAVTSLGDWGALLAFTFFGAAWLLYRRRPRGALALLAVTLLGRVLVELQKAALGRLRPDGDGSLVNVSNLSYPSGHAANSMIVFLSLALLLAPPGLQRRRAVAAAVAGSLVIGLTRPPLGVHWPSDIIGGWAFGLLWVLLCFGYAHTLKRKSNTSPS